MQFWTLFHDSLKICSLNLNQYQETANFVNFVWVDFFTLISNYKTTHIPISYVHEITVS